MLFARELPYRASALAVAAALADRPGLVLFGAGPVSYVGCEPTDHSTAVDPEPTLVRAPSPSTFASTPRWLGLLPYEAFRGGERGPTDARPTALFERPTWLRYPALVRVDERLTVIGDNLAAVHSLAERLRARLDAPSLGGPSLGTLSSETPALELLAAPEPAALHESRVRAVLKAIGRGDVYEVNVARQLRFRLHGSRLALLAELTARTRPPFPFLLNVDEHRAVVGASPELLLALDAHGRLRTSPIKGTRPRGIDAFTDARLRGELEADVKERAELAMVIDVERNDLGRVARVGSVRVPSAPRIERHPTLFHRVADVDAWLRPELGRAALLQAVLPSGSVTGAPKLRAMQLIAELEPQRRGVYTGGWGALGHDGSLQLAMAIRCFQIDGTEALWHVGGGIVADSDPAKEVVETGWKSRHLAALAGVTPAQLAGL